MGPLFGFLAGVIVDRFGPRRLMLAGIAMAGLALVGLGGTTTLSAFYFFYLFNALGYVCGGPLPNQVLLSRLFDKGRGKAMGFAYLGIGIGGMLVPLLAYALIEQFGWRMALRLLGCPHHRPRVPRRVLRARASDRGERGARAAPPHRCPSFPS